MSQSEERATIRRLVDGLPRCACGVVATKLWHIEHWGGWNKCDGCAERVAKVAIVEDLPYAAALRAMLALMAGWPEEP